MGSGLSGVSSLCAYILTLTCYLSGSQAVNSNLCSFIGKRSGWVSGCALNRDDEIK